MLHSHAGKLVPAIGWSYTGTTGNDLQFFSFVDLSMGFLDFLTPWCLDSKSEIPMGAGHGVFLSCPKKSHSHFHQTLLVQKVIETHLVSKVRGGELAKRNVHSTSRWGHGMIIEEVWVGRYCCFHVCKIQWATLTYLLKSLSGSVSYSHCSRWDLIVPFSCSAIRDIVLHSSHTRFVLWSCKASWSLATCNILCNNSHDMYGIIYGGTVKHSLLWPKLRKGSPKMLMLQMLFYLRLAKITWQDIHISCNLVSSPCADVSATPVNLEEFAQQYFCHTQDIQAECNSSIKSDFKIFFSLKKDKIGLGKFFFKVL